MITNEQYAKNENLINFITRVPSLQNDHIKPTVVNFYNRYVKKDFLAAARLESKTCQQLIWGGKRTRNFT